jgi:hypothetical protein
MKGGADYWMCQLNKAIQAMISLTMEVDGCCGAEDTPYEANRALVKSRIFSACSEISCA